MTTDSAQHPGCKITFLINSMEGGGAERAMSNLLHHLLPRLGGHQVDLLLLDDLPIKQDLPKGLQMTRLNGRGKMLASRAALAQYWSDPVNHPDICISFLARANVLNVWLARRFGHRAVISERVNTSGHLAGSRMAPLLAAVTRRYYPRADRVIAVSEGVATDLAENFKVPFDILKVIGNSIDREKLLALSRAPDGLKLPDDYFLGIGRLVTNKNFALTLDAYARSGVPQPLLILGQGPTEKDLRNQAETLDIGDRVVFAGFVDNPYPIMARARALISSSRAEGFPNTLIEAMTLGCPVIATDCPSGPADVLETTAQKGPPWSSEAHGILVEMEDRDAMAEAIRTLADSSFQAEFAARAARRSAHYGVDQVVNSYLDIISDQSRHCR